MERPDVSKEEFDFLVRNVRFAADNAWLDGAGETNMSRVRRVVEESLQFAIGNGLIKIVPQEEWPSPWLGLEPDDQAIKIV